MKKPILAILVLSLSFPACGKNGKTGSSSLDFSNVPAGSYVSKSYLSRDAGEEAPTIFTVGADHKATSFELEDGGTEVPVSTVNQNLKGAHWEVDAAHHEITLVVPVKGGSIRQTYKAVSEKQKQALIADGKGRKKQMEANLVALEAGGPWTLVSQGDTYEDLSGHVISTQPEVAAGAPDKIEFSAVPKAFAFDRSVHAVEMKSGGQRAPGYLVVSYWRRMAYLGIQGKLETQSDLGTFEGNAAVRGLMSIANGQLIFEWQIQYFASEASQTPSGTRVVRTVYKGK